MLTKFNLLICLLLAVTPAFTQELMYKKYNWESDPKIHTLTDEEKEDNYVILKDKILIDFVYQATNDLVMYETRHTIVHFNNEKGIEEMNKIIADGWAGKR